MNITLAVYTLPEIQILFLIQQFKVTHIAGFLSLSPFRAIH